MDVQKTTATIYRDVIQVNLEPSETQELIDILQQVGIKNHFVNYLIDQLNAMLECPF